MPAQPNILFLMTDQMQGQVLNPDHPCQTPNFDRLAGRGIRFRRAYTPNAVCSPARASLMTGLLPHNHGVLTVTHTVDDDQSCLRTQYPHWAQRLAEAGYRTGYFGKWHVERSERLEDFGWQTNYSRATDRYQAERRRILGENPPQPNYALAANTDQPPGYRHSIFYGVTDVPPEQRDMGITTTLALDYLDDVCQQAEPWCCFVSLTEPHDPFIAGQEAFDRYNVDDIPLCPNVHDPLERVPGLYRKTARVWANMTGRQKRQAAACYYASITEIDALFGRLIDKLEAAGQLNQTIIVLTSDHGELLGSHGLYTKNISGYEEVYNIPLVMCGPGIAQNTASEARVGLHDLCPTLLELASCEPFDLPDSRSFASLLPAPSAGEADFSAGFAEYYGGRIYLTQRVVWHDDWKFVFNGFDEDELYNLKDDPYELNNLAQNPAYGRQLRQLTAQMWQIVEATGDHSLLNSHYPSLRLAPYGPLPFTISDLRFTIGWREKS
jgi:arylsulfatase A-like enzyme